jgi:ABC-2 type transport system ATP-binding protein
MQDRPGVERPDPKPRRIELDAIDTALLTELSRDARTSFARLGAAVNLSAPAVKRRVDRLRARGVIEFTVRLDPALLGWATEANVEVFCAGATSPATMREAFERYPRDRKSEMAFSGVGPGLHDGPMTNDLAVEARSLVKHFGTTKAVDGIDLAIQTGSVYGLLGPNGAGKTTAVRMFCTLLRPDAGTATVLGHDVRHEPDAVRGLIGLTGQFASMDEDLTGMENLVLIARLYGYSRAGSRARAAELLHAFDLDDAADRQVKTFSGGMHRRIDLAGSMVISPRVLFLDEPTTGLDPRSRNQVWDIIRLLVDQGTTVLLTTQYLEEADTLADRIAVIDHGKVIAEGTPSELKASVGSSSVHLRLVDAAQRPVAQEVMAATLAVPIVLETDTSALSARIPRARDAGVLLPNLLDAGIDVAELSLGQPSLDEVFLALTGHHADDTTTEEVA